MNQAERLLSENSTLTVRTMAGMRILSTYGALPAVEVAPGKTGPVLLSVSHSGRNYPQSLVERSRLGRASLERLEDPLVDQLVQGAIDRGFGAVVARAPRAAIDVNRSLAELHPAAVRGRSGVAPTARAHAGLGLVPTRLNGIGDLWRGPIDEVELEKRVEHIHRPFHETIADQIDARSLDWSDVILLDCHSMPPRAPGEAQVVIGDRHGTTAAAWLVEAIETVVTSRGFSVARNSPFAGGHVVERHGDPARGIHAVQIEIDRAAYCARDARTPGPGFDRVATLFEALTASLDSLLSRRRHLAAE